MPVPASRQVHTDTHILTGILTDILTDIYIFTDILTHILTDTHIHRHTHTHIHTPMHTHTHILTGILTDTHILARAYLQLVEINTWFLIARRKWPQARGLEACFYVSWVALRNVLYPWLIYAFVAEWRDASEKCGSPWNPILVTPVFQAALTALNFQWTFALLYKQVKGSKQL